MAETGSLWLSSSLESNGIWGGWLIKYKIRLGLADLGRSCYPLAGAAYSFSCGWNLGSTEALNLLARGWQGRWVDEMQNKAELGQLGLGPG